MDGVICVSGGFDPLHAGHISMFREAAKHGPLTVILNSDAWLLRKKGFVFLPWQDRAAIIGDLRHVARVVEVDDSDGTVCEALNRLKPKYFANGGDRKTKNTPELALCLELGIEPVWESGGEKSRQFVGYRPQGLGYEALGGYVTLDEGKDYKVKKVLIDPGAAISLQMHRHRSEYWYMTGSNAMVELEGEAFAIAKGASPVVVGQGVKHQLANMGKEPLVVIEIQSGEYLGEDDIIRINERVKA